MTSNLQLALKVPTSKDVEKAVKHFARKVRAARESDRHAAAAGVEAVVALSNLKCVTARAAGGIALQDVEEGVAEVPEGWELDLDTDYYLPPRTP